MHNARYMTDNFHDCEPVIAILQDSVEELTQELAAMTHLAKALRGDFGIGEWWKAQINPQLPALTAVESLTTLTT